MTDIASAAILAEDRTPGSRPEADPQDRAARPRSRWADRIFRWSTGACAAIILGLLAVLVVFMVQGSMPAFREHGFGFILSPEWDPTNQRYGALTFIYGTVYTSAIGLAIALPLGVMTSVALVEILPKALSKAIGLAVELLAAIPSVLLGLWGIFVIVPIIRKAEVWIYKSPLHLRDLPLFSGAPIGIGYLSAGVLLAIMVLPLIVSVCREVMSQVPRAQKEAAYALGATKWEVIRTAVLPYGWRGVFGAGMLGLGRAFGETMAVTMVIGNTPQIKASLFATGYTLASVIANEFTEAPTDLAVSSLISLGLILFVLTLLINAGARLFLTILQRRYGNGAQAH